MRSAFVALSATFALVASGIGPIEAAASTGVTVVPAPSLLVSDLASGPDGNIWFTAHTTTAWVVGRTTPNGSITTFPLPADPSGSAPQQLSGLVSGTDGALYFGVQSGHYIGRITTIGTVSYLSVPGSATEGFELAVGADGHIWGAASPSPSMPTGFVFRLAGDGSAAVFPIPAGYAAPLGIQGSLTADSAGNLWFTQSSLFPGQTGVARVSMDGTITEFPISQPIPGFGSTFGPDGNLWMTTVGAAAVIRMTPSGTVSTVAVPEAYNSQAIALGPDGNLWFGEGGLGSGFPSGLGRLTTGGAVTDLSIQAPTPTSIISGPAPAGGADIWASSRFDQLQRVDLNIGGDTTAPTVSVQDLPGILPPGFTLAATLGTGTLNGNPTFLAVCYDTVGVFMNLGATDNSGGSGVRSLTYSLSGNSSGGSQSAGTAVIPVGAAGATLVSYSANDQAGNVSGPTTQLVLVGNSVAVTCVAPPVPTTSVPAHAGIAVTGAFTANGQTYPFTINGSF